MTPDEFIAKNRVREEYKKKLTLEQAKEVLKAAFQDAHKGTLRDQSTPTLDTLLRTSIQELLAQNLWELNKHYCFEPSSNSNYINLKFLLKNDNK